MMKASPVGTLTVHLTFDLLKAVDRRDRLILNVWLYLSLPR